MNTAQNAIDFEAYKLLPRAIVALLAVGSWSAQARVLIEAGDELMKYLTAASVPSVQQLKLLISK